MKWLFLLILVATSLAGCKSQTTVTDPFFGRTTIPPPPTGSVSGRPADPCYQPPPLGQTPPAGRFGFRTTRGSNAKPTDRPIDDGPTADGSTDDRSTAGPSDNASTASNAPAACIDSRAQAELLSAATINAGACIELPRAPILNAGAHVELLRAASVLDGIGRQLHVSWTIGAGILAVKACATECTFSPTV